MKIERFNESNQLNLTFLKFKEIVDINSKIKENIYKYLEWKRDPNEKIWFKNVRYYFRDDDFIIDYLDDWNGYDDSFYVTPDKMEEFLSFINDPDMYLNSKKYNI